MSYGRKTAIVMVIIGLFLFIIGWIIQLGYMPYVHSIINFIFTSLLFELLGLGLMIFGGIKYCIYKKELKI